MESQGHGRNATPGALALAFHFRCYTTDSNKRWELCPAPICAPVNGKYSYTYNEINTWRSTLRSLWLWLWRSTLRSPLRSLWLWLWLWSSTLRRSLWRSSTLRILWWSSTLRRLLGSITIRSTIAINRLWLWRLTEQQQKPNVDHCHQEKPNGVNSIFLKIQKNVIKFESIVLPCIGLKFWATQSPANHFME